MKTSGLVLDPEVSVDVEPGVATLYDRSRFINNGVMTDVTWVQLPSGLWVMSFNSTTSKVDCGSNNSLLISGGSVSFWCYRNNRDDVHYLYDARDGGGENRCYLLNDDDTLFWTAPVPITAYVDAVETDEVTAAVWHFVAVTNETFFGISTIKLGTNNASNTAWDGYIALPRIYNYTLSPGQVLQRFEATRRLFGV